MKKLSLFIVFFGFFLSPSFKGCAQMLEKKEIYQILLDDFYGKEVTPVLLADKPENGFIQKTNFLYYLQLLFKSDTIDVCKWYEFLISVGSKRRLKKDLLPSNIKTLHPIKRLKWDSLYTAYNKSGRYVEDINTILPGAKGFTTLTDVIFSADRNQAIAEVDLTVINNFSGKGMLYFLEKRKGKWVVIFQVENWRKEGMQ